MASRVVTERLVLEPFRMTDAALCAELIGERGPGARGFGTTVDGARRNIARMLRAVKDSGIGFLAIRLAEAGDLIGYCGLFVGRASIDEPEIAYELLRRAHGHGYATEAAVAVIEAAAATGRRRLWSTVRVGNNASLRVLDKAGFRRHHTEAEERGGDTAYLVRDLQPV
jgi:RimJ/RimL family protein N-acetyltransferase